MGAVMEPEHEDVARFVEVFMVSSLKRGAPIATNSSECPIFHFRRTTSILLLILYWKYHPISYHIILLILLILWYYDTLYCCCCTTVVYYLQEDSTSYVWTCQVCLLSTTRTLRMKMYACCWLSSIEPQAIRTMYLGCPPIRPNWLTFEASTTRFVATRQPQGLWMGALWRVKCFEALPTTSTYQEPEGNTGLSLISPR